MVYLSFPYLTLRILRMLKAPRPPSNESFVYMQYTWQVWIITWMNITYVQLYIQTTSSQLLSRTSNSIRYRAKLSLREDTHCNTQFYIQFLYKPHLRTWILLFGSFGRVRAVREKIFNFLYIVASVLQSKKYNFWI